MLPNRMNLTKQTEEHLKKLKQFTGISPNVSARIAFFRSIESGFKCTNSATVKLDGALVLDKVTWLGETQLVTELMMKMHYPNLQGRELMAAWAAHVEDGISAIRNYRSITKLSTSI
ncbi:DNA sulfur modification protein DndE [Shewanella sp. 6_MG-2023]|uniref:DNA sulfur modification protein DndE n=1 Tax=Shewanella sp. 6_MG-2023 TaxID=3062660 RepID=UPI0026E31239|nr:DNA sulfur modification protein DndE [Shewanella sp. 6_MG-2023]MDO6620402.1 DNA sulfur modification protein DndE [Shewanella sp. 6_MG-2023]